MVSCKERTDIVILGVKVGTSEVWITGDDDNGDLFIQCEIFHPATKMSHIPASHCISFHLLSGKFKVWGDDGKVENEGVIFQQLA